MRERQEFFGREIPIRELIAEKHSDNRSSREGIQNNRRLPKPEAQARQTAENERQPRAPDEEFEHHHQEELEARSGIHGGVGTFPQPRESALNLTSPMSDSLA